MKISFLIIALSIASLGFAQPFYVDPVVGNDANTGGISSPFKTLSKALTALGSNISTIYLKGGTYTSTSKISLSKSGSSVAYIKIWAFPGEKPVFDFTGNTSDGFSISGSYYHLKGIEIKKAGHNGINISGNNNIIENCVAHDNQNTGIHITGGNGAPPPGPANNLILNCDAYQNFDPPTGGDADGFSAKWTVGTGNIFRGCRAWNNSDDGWDLWMCTGTILIDSCYAFRNGIDIWHTGKVDGNGNGFKLGGNNVATPHIVRHCLAFDNAGNGGKGFDENNNLAGQTIYNCTSFRNKSYNFALYNTTLTSGTHVVKNCISYKGGQSDNIRNAIMEKNSWQGFTVTNTDFQSVDTAHCAAARDLEGHLQKSNFMRLAAGSLLIDAGVTIGFPFEGKAPDLGAFEYKLTTDIFQIRHYSAGFDIEQILPNPASKLTTIQFSVRLSGNYRLKILNSLNVEVADLKYSYLNPGSYSCSWIPTNLSEGMYFCLLSDGKFTISKKIMIVK